MHCKHCGTKIDSDSSFCSSCGGKLEQTNEKIYTVLDADPNEVKSTLNITTSANNQDKGILIAFFTMAGMRILWLLSDIVNTEDSFAQSYINFVLKPSFTIFWCTPLVLAFISRQKSQRIILLIIGLILLGHSLFETYFQTS